MIIIGAASFFLLKAIFSDTNDVSIMNKSLLQIQGIIDDKDVNLISDNIETQNSLMDQLSGKGFNICGVQDGKVIFTNMNHKEQTFLAEYIVQDNLYTANQTLWVTDDDFFLLCRRIETKTSPITLIVIGSNDVDRLEDKGDIAAIISISILIISVIVFIVILFSLYLANKMLKKIMIPLNHLCDGAQRIQEGNLDQDIYCEGTEELEKVCNTFNEMQHQLKANVKKNEKYERDRNEMLAGISHDLRTPLTSIKSYVKGLQDDIAKTPNKQKEYLDVVYRKTCRIEELINSLFLFSKLETGKFPFDFKSVSIQNFIVTLLDIQEYDLKKNNAILSLKSTCTDQKVYIDGAQMTRAITNILDNSLKYNPNRQVHITVTLTEENERIIIRIQDDGVGVTDEQLLRLFDSFYRGDESRNNASEGSGLGLAIAKNIVTANNGSIYAENFNGLTVIIELPVEKEENQ
jgi:signal transduction histidine kinase